MFKYEVQHYSNYIEVEIFNNTDLYFVLSMREIPNVAINYFITLEVPIEDLDKLQALTPILAKIKQYSTLKEVIDVLESNGIYASEL